VIEINTMGAQGDVLFRRIDTLPDTVREHTKEGPIVVAHSETGHHHAIERGPGIRMFEDPADPFVCYLQMDIGVSAEVVHHRAWDTHETMRLLGSDTRPTVYKIHRQREWTPEGLRRVMD